MGEQSPTSRPDQKKSTDRGWIRSSYALNTRPLTTLKPLAIISPAIPPIDVNAMRFDMACLPSMSKGGTRSSLGISGEEKSSSIRFANRAGSSHGNDIWASSLGSPAGSRWSE